MTGVARRTVLRVAQLADGDGYLAAPWRGFQAEEPIENILAATRSCERTAGTRPI